jgi:hypothetical protein
MLIRAIKSKWGCWATALKSSGGHRMGNFALEDAA